MRLFDFCLYIAFNRFLLIYMYGNKSGWFLFSRERFFVFGNYNLFLRNIQTIFIYSLLLLLQIYPNFHLNNFKNKC